jgi:hypothetical protein
MAKTSGAVVGRGTPALAENALKGMGWLTRSPMQAMHTSRVSMWRGGNSS